MTKSTDKDMVERVAARHKHAARGVRELKEVLNKSPSSMATWVGALRALGWKTQLGGGNDPYQAQVELRSPEGNTFVLRPSTTYMAEPVNSHETRRLDRWLREETNVLQQVQERLTNER
jgi:hypothetical protein